MVKETEEGTFLPSQGTFIGQNVCVGGCSDFLCRGDVDQRRSVLPLYQHQCRMIGNDGITVNVVAPGLTLTPAIANLCRLI
jgi:hypothetical protein